MVHLHMSCRYTQGPSDASVFGDSHVLSSLEAKIIQERESLFTELRHVQDDLVSYSAQL